MIWTVRGLRGLGWWVDGEYDQVEFLLGLRLFTGCGWWMRIEAANIDPEIRSSYLRRCSSRPDTYFAPLMGVVGRDISAERFDFLLTDELIDDLKLLFESYYHLELAHVVSVYDTHLLIVAGGLADSSVMLSGRLSESDAKSFATVLKGELSSYDFA